MEQPKSRPDGAIAFVFLVALMAAVAVLVVGIYLVATRRETALLSTGIFATIIVVVTWLLSAGIASWKASAEAERAGMMRSLDDRLKHLAELLNTLAQQQLLSDRAKSVAYRNKDRQALRDAIREEMNAKDWDAALVLANGMEREFGYVQEATALRAEINNNRTEVIQRQVDSAVAVVDQYIMAEQWTQAVREAERLMAVYPNDPRVQALPAAIESRRQFHKKSLRESMEAAANRHDFDGALEILRRLDPYLTPAEASGMQEMVRGLLKDRINSFKDAFSKAYQDHHYAEAVRISEVVISEHPNSRLALELKDMTERLRQLAAEQQQQLQPA